MSTLYSIKRSTIWSEICKLCLERFSTVEKERRYLVSQTQIQTYTLPFIINRDGEIIFKVINLKGQTVFETESFYRAGNHEIRFNAENFCSGIYLYSISNDNATCYKKMLLIK